MLSAATDRGISALFPGQSSQLCHHLESCSHSGLGPAALRHFGNDALASRDDSAGFQPANPTGGKFLAWPVPANSRAERLASCPLPVLPRSEHGARQSCVPPFGLGVWRLPGTLRNTQTISLPQSGEAERFINISAPGKFRQWYEDNLNERCRRISQEPEPFWSTAFAVGDREWLEKLSSHDEAVDEYIRPCDADSGNDSGLYALTPPQSVFKRIWRRLSNS